MRILVTGGAGFVGSTFVRHLLATTDDEITVFDALSYAGNRTTIADLHEDHRFHFVHGDVTDREAVRAVMVGQDAVAHLAAETHVDRSLWDPDVFERTNCVGTDVVCDEAVRAEVGRFLHVSTDEVYGSIEVGASTESDPLNPTSPYAQSKARSDVIALRHHRDGGLPVVVTRSSNQFGPFQFPEKLIPYFVTLLVTGKDVPLYGDGLHRRDWLHVADNCAALDTVLRRGEVGEIYNVAGHHERTNREVTEAVLACLGLDGSRIAYVADRPGHDRRYALDTTKLAALGPPPGRPFEESLEATVRWYLDHRTWWEPLVGEVRNR